MVLNGNKQNSKLKGKAAVIPCKCNYTGEFASLLWLLTGRNKLIRRGTNQCDGHTGFGGLPDMVAVTFSVQFKAAV